MSSLLFLRHYIVGLNLVPYHQRKEEARVAKERREKAWQRDHAYDDLFSEDALAQSSNQDRSEDFLDDFM
jgi:hypothetical protein